MRLEELGNGNYVKVPDKLESELVKTVNRFFNSDMEDFDKSKEAIILETQRRLKPLIVNLVKRIAWEQGKDIYEPMIREIINSVLVKEIEDLKTLLQEMKDEFFKHRTFLAQIDDSITSIINLPSDLVVNVSHDVIMVSVNGARQIEDVNYKVIHKDDTAKSIEFFETLENGDHVYIECWIYSMGDGGTT